MSSYYKFLEDKLTIEKKLENIRKEIKNFENINGTPFDNIEDLFDSYGVKTKEEFLLQTGMTEQELENYLKQNEDDLYHYKELFKMLQIYKKDLDDILYEIDKVEDKIKRDVDNYFDDLKDFLEEQDFIEEVEWKSQIPNGSAYLEVKTIDNFFVIRFSDHSSYNTHGGFKGYDDFGEPMFYEKADFEFLLDYDINILENLPNKMIVLDTILTLNKTK